MNPTLQCAMKLKEQLASKKWAMALIALWIISSALSACSKKEQVDDIRPVRYIVVNRDAIEDQFLLTGQLRARDEVSLAFRLSGKLIERLVDVGDMVKAGQIVARLDPENEKNARNAAEAAYEAAQAVLEQAQANERRANNLIKRNAISQSDYEVALRQLKTAQAEVNSAQAKLNLSEDQLRYTELKAEADGVITDKGAEPGEVVPAGRMILLLARQEGRDAVFDMPAKIIREGLSDQQQVDVRLADNPDIATSGQVREISPQADPATRTHKVKVALHTASPEMLLGSTVIGSFKLRAATQIKIPSSALNMSEGNSAVWVIDAQDNAVHIRPVTIARYTQDSIIIAEGLQTGERVVTAGAQTLHEGQIVKLMDPL